MSCLDSRGVLFIFVAMEIVGHSFQGYSFIESDEPETASGEMSGKL